MAPDIENALLLSAARLAGGCVRTWLGARTSGSVIAAFAVDTPMGAARCGVLRDGVEHRLVVAHAASGGLHVETMSADLGVAATMTLARRLLAGDPNSLRRILVGRWLDEFEGAVSLAA